MQPGWYPDPSGRHPLRWHDGQQWTPQVLDGWQRPLVDPLDAAVAASTPRPPAPTPPPPVAAGSTDAVPGTALPPDAPAPATPPAPTTVGTPTLGTPSPPPGIPAGRTQRPGRTGRGPTRYGLVFRLAVIAVAAGVQGVGFFVSPWARINYGTGWVQVGYLDYADLLRGLGAELGGWHEAYLDGVALLLALVATAGTLAVVLAYHLTGRERGDLLMFAVVGLTAFAGGFGSDIRFPDSGPTVAIEAWQTGNGLSTVMWGTLLLAFALFLGSPLRSTTPARNSS